MFVSKKNINEENSIKQGKLDYIFTCLTLPEDSNYLLNKISIQCMFCFLLIS